MPDNLLRVSMLLMPLKSHFIFLFKKQKAFRDRIHRFINLILINDKKIK